MTAMPELLAALDEPAAQRAVVEDAQRDLDGGDRHELERLVELVAVDVREPDARDHALVEQPAERAHGGAPRRAGIGRVEQVEVDRRGRRARLRLASQSAQDRLGAAVRDPAAAGRVIPPLVTIRALAPGSGGASARARAGARRGPSSLSSRP